MTATISKRIEGDAKYDLTFKLAPYMDLHLLLLPMLNFLIEERGPASGFKSLYQIADLKNARFELIKESKLMDTLLDYIKENQECLRNVPSKAELASKRSKVLDQLAFYQTESKPLVDLIKDESTLSEMKEFKNFNLTYLENHYDVTLDVMESFYKLAKLKYDIGCYSEASHYLGYYHELTKATHFNIHALWGKYTSEIMDMDWVSSMKLFRELDEAIESNKAMGSPLEQLQQRTWLLHWSLFTWAYSNNQEDRDAIIDTMFRPRYLEAIQTNAPWLLRYLTAGVILHKRRRQLIPDLIAVLAQEEKESYTDPIIQFIQCIYVQYDFDLAEEKLNECKKVFVSDTFLYRVKDDFMENARLFTFETYCRLHDKIDISMLSKKLAMEGDEAEKWIVNLIRGARFDAKINSKDGCIIMGTFTSSVYQQVIEKTRELSARTCNMASQLDRLNSINKTTTT